jgi:phenylpropionate dioxygenase-like ring-hydroxylating dioxygenase large terminal subunit
VYADAWYAIGFDAHTQREAPVAITLLGTPVVLWYDGPRGAWSAAIYLCPHRLAPLSKGRVDSSGHIECPYHGWAFDHDGECTRLPQLEGPLERAVPRACATSLRVVTRDGILWLWAAPLLGSSAPADESRLERFLVDAVRAQGCVHLDYSRDLQMDASTLIENVLDPSHLPFTHDGTISRRSAAGPVLLRLVSRSTRDHGPRLERGLRHAALGGPLPAARAHLLPGRKDAAADGGRALDARAAAGGGEPPG